MEHKAGYVMLSWGIWPLCRGRCLYVLCHWRQFNTRWSKSVSLHAALWLHQCEGENTNPQLSNQTEILPVGEAKKHYTYIYVCVRCGTEFCHIVWEVHENWEFKKPFKKKKKASSANLRVILTKLQKRILSYSSLKVS